MGRRASYADGTFCWADLATTDPDGARSFYGALFGWEAEPMPIPGGGTYTMLRHGGRDAAALAGQPEEQRAAGVPPHWVSYVSLDDVDAGAASAGELGGRR
jgi:predicted enzyme related to lactoylglutathione lyase